MITKIDSFNKYLPWKRFRKKFTDKKAKVTRAGVRNKRSLFSISKKYTSSSCFGTHALFRLESQRSFWIYVKQEYLLTVQKGQWNTQQVNPKSSDLFQIKSFRSLSPTINAKFQKSTSYSHTVWHFCKCKSYIYQFLKDETRLLLLWHCSLVTLHTLVFFSLSFSLLSLCILYIYIYIYNI